MDPQIFTAICSVVSALIAAGGAAWGVNRSTNTQIALMGSQIQTLEGMIKELKAKLDDHASLLRKLDRIEVRMDTVEREIKELKNK